MFDIFCDWFTQQLLISTWNLNIRSSKKKYMLIIVIEIYVTVHRNITSSFIGFVISIYFPTYVFQNQTILNIKLQKSYTTFKENENNEHYRWHVFALYLPYVVLQLILWNGTSMICSPLKWVGELHLGSSVHDTL